MQRGRAAVASRVDVDAEIEQPFEDRHVAETCGVAERGDQLGSTALPFDDEIGAVFSADGMPSRWGHASLDERRRERKSFDC